jgi:hypothetical protein
MCHEKLCRNCTQFLEAGTFSFMSVIPPELSHSKYCSGCFAAHIETARVSYEETMEKAKNVFFFFTTQKKNPPLLKRARESISVLDCADRDETILRLAFTAVTQDFNAIIEGDVTHEKIRLGAYQTTRWKGTGVPALVDEIKMERYS